MSDFISRQRLDYIDAAKAVAIISVVIGHTLLWNVYGKQVWDKSTLMSIVCTYHNFLFMFLSGMVSVTVIDKTRILPDILKRFRCLLIPACVVVITFCILTSADITHFIQDPMKWGYWYLFVLFELYLFSYPFAVIPTRYMKWVYVAIVPIWIYAYRHTYIFPPEIDNSFEVNLLVTYFPYFFAGGVVKRHKLHDHLFSLPVLVVCIAVTALQGLIYNTAGHYLIEYVITFAEIIGIVTLCKLLVSLGRCRWLTYIPCSSIFSIIFP